jgi:hypothetical protein
MNDIWLIYPINLNIYLAWFSCNQMKANPDKFQAIAIGKKSMDTNIVLDLAGNKIKCENEAKLLEVIIDFELKFN